MVNRITSSQRFVFNFTLFVVPSYPPETPKCDVLSSTSIYITWSPPPIEGQNGKIKGYRVSYISTDELYGKLAEKCTETTRTLTEPNFSFLETDPHVVKSTNQYLTVENLKKYTNYSVTVLAYTKMGDGAKTKPFFCRTHEDGNGDVAMYCKYLTFNIFV